MESRGRYLSSGRVPNGEMYATFLFGRRVTPWRPHVEAVEEAIDMGHAARDEWGAIYFWVGAELRREA